MDFPVSYPPSPDKGGFPLKETSVGCPFCRGDRKSRPCDRDLIALISPHCNPFFAYPRGFYPEKINSREVFLNEYKYIIASFANTISARNSGAYPYVKSNCPIRHPPYSLQGRLLYPQRLKKIVLIVLSDIRTAK